MKAQNVQDIIDADISDKWKEILADICRGESSADTDANNASKLRDEFLMMQKFIDDKAKGRMNAFDQTFEPILKSFFGNAEWFRQKHEREL